MSNKIVLDASEFITLLAKENGFEIVKQHLKNAVISSVNVAEIYKYCMDKQQLTESDCKNIMAISGIKIIDFSNEHALISAKIYSQISKYGLSLGDRACIALAISTSSPLLTCDQIWQQVKLDVEVIMAR